MSNNFSKNLDKNFNGCTTLDKAELNASYIIVDCDLPKKLQRRFAELGFIVGAKVTVIKPAPLGDPVEVNVLGYSLCARAKELKHFKVKRAYDE